MTITCTLEYYLSIERKEIGSFVKRWMDLESVIQSKVSQTKKNRKNTCINAYIWNLASSWITALSWQRGLHNSVKL